MKPWTLIFVCAPLAMMSCSSTPDAMDPRVEALCRAIDEEDYARVQGELPTLAAEDVSHGTAVVEYGLSKVEMPPDAPASTLPQTRRLLTALDVPGPLQSRVGFGRGLAAFKDGDDASARVHFETFVHTSDGSAEDRAAAYFALAVLDPDPDGMPNRAHWTRYRRLEADGAIGVQPELVSKLEDVLGTSDDSALASHRDL